MKVIIVGADAAGMSAATRLKRNLKEQVEILAYEKEGIVSYGACGIPFYISGHIEKAKKLIARTPEQLEESGIDLKTFHRVEGVDLEKKRVKVRNLEDNHLFEESYDYLIVATGARANPIPGVLDGWQGVYTPRTIPEARGLKAQLMEESTKDVVIYGAGAVALEIAVACKEQGRKVSILARSTLLSAMDREFSEKILAEFREHNIAVYTAAQLKAVSVTNGSVSGVTIQAQGQEITLPCQLLVNASGIRPNTELIAVGKGPNGAILVDEEMRTSVASVFAAGDCSMMRSFLTGKYQYAPLGTNANKQGRIVADVLAGKSPQKLKLLGSTAIRLLTSDVAKIGLSEKDAQRANISFGTNTIKGNSYAGYYSRDLVDIKLVYEKESRRMLGAQLFGKGSVAERANYFAIAMSAGLTVDEMGMMDLCYSPPFNGVWDAALIAAHTAK